MLPIASFSSRFAAFKVDLLVFMITFEFLILGINKFTADGISDFHSFILYLLWTYLYYNLPTQKFGQTLGKKLFSVKVVKAGTDLLPSAGQVFVREIPGKFLSSLPLGLGYLWAYQNPERKTWHDSLGKTQVVTLLPENEKTFRIKFQHAMISLATIPLSIGFVVFLMLYTALPLPSIQTQVENAGVHLGKLTGSLAGGLHMTELSRHTEDQNYKLADVEIKFDFWAMVIDRVFLLEKVSIQQGTLEVPEGFSWGTVWSNIASFGQPNPETAAEGNSITLQILQLGHLEIKNLTLSHNKVPVSVLKEFTATKIEKTPQSFQIAEMTFAVPGLRLNAKDLKATSRGMQIENVTGTLTPEMVPLLKSAVDFHMKGTFAATTIDSAFEGGMIADKVKFSYKQGGISMNIDQLKLDETFKMTAPIENFNLKWTAQGASVLEIMMKQETTYGAILCGAEFKPSATGATYEVDGRKYQLSLSPKPIQNAQTSLMRKEAVFDDLFETRLKMSVGTSTSGSPGSLIEIPVSSTMCDQHPFAAPAQIGPLPMAPDLMPQARIALRDGKYVEGLALLDQMQATISQRSPQDIGAYHNLKAWFYFYSNQLVTAAISFNDAFKARQDVADAEGLERTYEMLKNQTESEKWFNYIQKTLQARPDLKNHLSANMLKKVSEGVPAEAPSSTPVPTPTPPPSGASEESNP